MAAEKCLTCLIGAMDSLWFHQTVLFSESPSFHLAENPETPLPCSPKNSSQISAISAQETSPVSSVITAPQDETSSQESDLDKEITRQERLRPTKLNLVSSKARSHSSSSLSSQKQPRNLRYSRGSARRLQRTMSCKSLVELELEEVKGFVDLGFVFSKENVNKRMMSLIPGLQRLDAYKNEEDNTEDSFEFGSSNDDFEDEGRKGITRPYLSEAWLIRRPDSPLLNLRIPSVCTNADMKKHLKNWARTVASAVQQDS